jgi:transposase
VLSVRLHQLVGELRDEWRKLDGKIGTPSREFVAPARNDPATRRLTLIPGIGVPNATALVAATMWQRIVRFGLDPFMRMLAREESRVGGRRAR